MPAIKFLINAYEASGKTTISSQIKDALILNLDEKPYGIKDVKAIATLKEYSGMENFIAFVNEKITKYKEKFGKFPKFIVFDTITTGAANDIEEATQLARNMITQYGMSEKFGLMKLASRRSMYLDNGYELDCSDETATVVDEEVKELLNKSYEKAKSLLSSQREALDKISAYLIEKETITGKEFMKMFTEITGIEEEKNDRVNKK